MERYVAPFLPVAFCAACGALVGQVSDISLVGNLLVSTFRGVGMDCPGAPSYSGFRPSADQPEPDGLLAELDQAQVALMIAEYNIRLWRANSAPGSAYGAYAAHEALDDAGRAIDRIAELLRIEAAGTLQHVDSGGVE